MLKESDNLDILGMIFDSKITFEKHIRSIFKAASQMIGILHGSPVEYIMIDFSLRDAFGCRYTS